MLRTSQAGQRLRRKPFGYGRNGRKNMKAILKPLLSPLSLLLSLLLAFTGPSFAAAASPDEQVKATVNEVLGVLREHKDKRALRQVAEQKVAPQFDFQEMT